MNLVDFDLRGHLTLVPARSQIARGGFAAVENCTWATTSDTLFDFGYGDHAPADLRSLDNELEGLGAYAGGETWERNLRVIAFLAPDLAAAAAIEYPDDVAARLRELGARGEEVHWAGWCTPNAVWTAGNLWGGISHAGRSVYADAGGVAVWNVWSGYLVYQADAFWNAAYDGGGILVFNRSLIGGETDLTPAESALLSAIANKVLADPGYRFGANPGDTSSPYYPGTANAWRWKYSDWYVDQHPELSLPRGPQSGAVPGTGAYTTQWGFVDEIADADKDAPRLADILAAVKAIPAGPPGAKGDTGPQGPAGATPPHTHSVSGVTSSAP